MMKRVSIERGLGVKVYRCRIERNSNDNGNDNNDNDNSNSNNNDTIKTLEVCGLPYKGYKVMVHNRDDESIDIVTIMMIGDRSFYICTCNKENSKCKHISIARRYIRECNNGKNKRGKGKQVSK